MSTIFSLNNLYQTNNYHRRYLAKNRTAVALEHVTTISLSLEPLEEYIVSNITEVFVVSACNELEYSLYQGSSNIVINAKHLTMFTSLSQVTIKNQSDERIELRLTHG